MAETDIRQTTTTSLASTQKDFSVSPVSTDAATGQKEYVWSNTKWTQYFGYYQQIPELKRAIDIIATWSIGKGYKSDPETTEILDSIMGAGNDSFNTILENMVRVMFINGDSFAEIIRDPETGMLVNLKTLDPSSISIITNSKGRIIRYEQTFKTPENTNILKFKSNEIFHLSRNRVADEIVGQSIIKELEVIILARNEAIADWKKVMHRNINPVRLWHIDDDDPGRIEAFKAKVETAVKDAENIFIPRGNVEVEVSSIAPNATLNGIPWIRELNSYFFEATGIPEIVAGSGKQFTDTSSKVKYLVWQQSVEEEQLFLEEQVGLQLGIAIKLIFPASLERGILQEQSKEGTLVAAQPNDVIAELEGAT